MTRDEYKAITGFSPQEDDLDRAGCDQAGQIGHSLCGLCDLHNKPRFLCGCMLHPNGTVTQFQMKQMRG